MEIRPVLKPLILFFPLCRSVWSWPRRRTRRNTHPRNIRRTDAYGCQKQANKIARMFKSRDPFEIVRGLNVILVHYPLDGVRGFYQYFQRNNIIYLMIGYQIPKSVLFWLMSLDICFYIKKANAIFMDTRTQLNGARYEREADLFAMELLFPDEVLSEYQEMGYSIDQISRITGYNKRLIKLKLD